jgi:hypothetical protein
MHQSDPSAELFGLTANPLCATPERLAEALPAAINRHEVGPARQRREAVARMLLANGRIGNATALQQGVQFVKQHLKVVQSGLVAGLDRRNGWTLAETAGDLSRP